MSPEAVKAKWPSHHLVLANLRKCLLSLTHFSGSTHTHTQAGQGNWCQVGLAQDWQVDIVYIDPPRVQFLGGGERRCSHAAHRSVDSIRWLQSFAQSSYF